MSFNRIADLQPEQPDPKRELHQAINEAPPDTEEYWRLIESLAQTNNSDKGAKDTAR